MESVSFTAFIGTALGVWLMILFAGIIFWAFRPKNKKRFEDDAMIPFEEL